MAIERAAINIKRMTVREQIARNLDNRGKGLGVRVFDPTTGYIVKAAKLFATSPELRALIPASKIEVRTPLGLLMDPGVIKLTPEEIDAKAAEMDALFEIANPRIYYKVQNLPEMIPLGGGSFPVEGSQLFGSQKPNASYVNISAIEIGKYPVTVAQYREFYEATDHGAKIVGQEGAEEQRALLGDCAKDRHPMTRLTQAEKEEYAAWLKMNTGGNWDLLTAAEMEYAMRGNEGRVYPWGNDWKQASYYNSKATAPIDAFPAGATPEGIAGFGIVWEATKGCYGSYDPKITDNPQGPSKGDYIEVRGGSAWSGDRGYFRGARRNDINPGIRDYDVGFRLAKRT